MKISPDHSKDAYDPVLRRRVARMTERLIERALCKLAKQRDNSKEPSLPSPLIGTLRDR